MTGRHSPSMAAEDSTHWPKPWYRLTAGSSYAAHNPPKTIASNSVSAELLAGLQRGRGELDYVAVAVAGGARCWRAAGGRTGQHPDFVHPHKAVRCPSHCDIG